MSPVVEKSGTAAADTSVQTGAGDAPHDCEHVWQGHDVYGENCTKCNLWRGCAYDHAPTDPHHGGKIWSEKP